MGGTNRRQKERKWYAYRYLAVVLRAARFLFVALDAALAISMRRVVLGGSDTTHPSQLCRMSLRLVLYTSGTNKYLPGPLDGWMEVCYQQRWLRLALGFTNFAVQSVCVALEHACVSFPARVHMLCCQQEPAGGNLIFP